jgi:hypothetical protein
MQLRSERPGRSNEEQSDGISFLSRRVRQEAKAAVRASSLEATTIHVVLATAYAKRLGQDAAERWVQEHRVW